MTKSSYVRSCLKIALFLLVVAPAFAQPEEGATLNIDLAAARTEFDATYQELAHTNPEAAEFMRADFEACERGEFHFTEVERAYVENIDRTEAKSMFDSAYQEALARGDTVGAEMMKTQFEAFERGEMPVMDPVHMEAEFERHYQEALAQGDTQGAEMMKQHYESFKEGDMHAAMDTHEIEAVYQEKYQEALAHDPMEAEKMQAEFERWAAEGNERNTDHLQDNRYDADKAQHCIDDPTLPECQVH